MIVVHHNDADGRGSAAVAYHFGVEGPFYETDYRENFPIDKIPVGSEVAILDFSPENEAIKTWLWLVDNCKKVIWIDHHKSSIKIFNQFRDLHPDLAKKVDNFFYENRAGIWLSWNYFGENSNQRRPRVIEMIDKFDRWVHEDNQEILDFVAGLDSYDYSPTAPIWSILFSQDAEPLISRVCKRGLAIRQYQNRQSKQAIKNIGYETTFEGKETIVVNSLEKGSKFFESVKDKYSLYIRWTYDGQKYEVSLYRRDDETLDVSAICEKYGGGGHKGTGGFVVEQLPEELRKGDRYGRK